MWTRIGGMVATAGVIVGLAIAPANGYADIFAHLHGEPAPPSLSQVARMIDGIQSDILNQGTVVVKQPDVWSQARMTKFRKEFEEEMKGEVNQFEVVLAARIARSDTASLASQTSLGAALTPLTPNTPLQASPAQIATDRQAAIGTITNEGAIASITPATQTTNFALLNSASPVAVDADGQPELTLPFGLEPNVQLDQKADYITHLHRLRRVNLGDDNADSAGYGLYLLRVPVSIQPGDKTVKGHGAIVNMTMRHDFAPNFLPSTYRNLVINDLIDMLAPVVTEAIRTGNAWKYRDEVTKYLEAKRLGQDLAQVPRSLRYSDPRTEEAETASLPNNKDLSEHLRQIAIQTGMLRVLANTRAVARTGPRTYPIAPSDVNRVFVAQNLLNLAYAAQTALGLGGSKWPLAHKVNPADVRSYLRQELESAYDLMAGKGTDQVAPLMDVSYVEDLTDKVNSRVFEGPKGAQVDSDDERNEFDDLYESFANRLPGNLRFRSIGVLSWGIAIEAGLLNRKLREDMKEVKGAEGYACPANVDELIFYPPTPLPDAEVAFQEYIKARWPMITFSLEPVTDQQNIEDAFTRRRDLQLAVAFALSSGRISFRQAIQYNRQLQYEAQTIALNQTVSSFAHGTDTFGWRFTPRYQTPPEESNGRAISNLLLRGGPGANYQIKNSKIEPGMRELTAVVVMPSFVRGMRLDVDGNWFHLHDPDDRKIHTARTVELGRRINEARAALAGSVACGLYRPEDTERLGVKLHQLERMLPMQTQFVKVPYENTLGGFALFTQGASALVPELSGYQGIEYIDPDATTELIVYGRDFSIYETSVVVGGKTLRPEPQPAATQEPQGADGEAADAAESSTAGGTFDILSREVMRVRIPAGVAPATLEDTKQVVELYVATPNGISNRLQIPVRPAVEPEEPEPAPAVATATSYAFVNPGLTVGLHATKVKDQASITPEGFESIRSATPLRIQPIDAKAPLPATISLEMAFPLVANAVTPSIRISDIPLTRETGTYELDREGLERFAQNLYETHFKGTTFPVPPRLVSLPVRVLAPAGPDGVAPPLAPVLNRLEISFELILKAKAADAARAAAPKVASAPGPDALRGQDKAVDAAVRRTSTVRSARVVRPATQIQDVAGADGTTIPASPAPAPAAPASAAAAAIPSSTQAIVVLPQGVPRVNVTVPITNQMPGKTHRGLFRNRAPGSANPAAARGPLLERLLGRP